jgi:hypothetical protein
MKGEISLTPKALANRSLGQLPRDGNRDESITLKAFANLSGTISERFQR